MESKQEIWDSIRCYDGEEIPAAMQYIAHNDTFEPLMRFIHPDKSVDECREMLLGVSSADDFQKIAMLPGARRVAECFTSGVEDEGFERLDAGKGYLFISNHRDISVDAGMLQLVLNNNGLPTTEVAFGENLIFNDFFFNICKSNKLFSVPRFTDKGKYVHYAPVLAEYIRSRLASGISVWIAQRNGRTKDGFDMTEPALLKLFMLGSRVIQSEQLEQLNIVPMAISYEYEPCDAQKVREVFITRRDGTYKKSADEDYKSVVSGIVQAKGLMHYTACEPLSTEDILSVTNGGNVDFHALATLIDHRIYSGYHCFKSNFVAYDILYGSDGAKNGDEYDDEYRMQFENYVSNKVDELVVELGEEHRNELRRMFLDIYANPVINKL